MLLIAIRKARLAMLCLALAGGVCAAAHARARSDADDRAIAPLITDRFVTVVAPIDRDWSTRGEAHVLRCARFVADGVAIELPLTIYTRFAPPTIDDAALHSRRGISAAQRERRRGADGEVAAADVVRRLAQSAHARGVEPRAGQSHPAVRERVSDRSRAGRGAGARARRAADATTSATATNAAGRITCWSSPDCRSPSPRR